MKLEVPEPRVNDVWRALVIGNFLIADGDRMNYSAGNAYERLYQAECGDTVRALALFGHAQAAAKMIPPLLDYTRDKCGVVLGVGLYALHVYLGMF